MKSLNLIICAWTVAVNAGVIEPRQVASLAGLGKTTALKPVKVEHPAPTYEGSDVKRIKLTYGPFKLRAGNGGKREGNSISLDPQGTGWRYVAADFPTDITILSAGMSIRLANGDPISNANGVYNHHAFVSDVSKTVSSYLQCAGTKKNIPALNSISGSAADAGIPKPAGTTTTTTTLSKRVTGNYIAKNHKILLQGDLVNYNNATKEVYMVEDVQYVEGKATGLMEIASHLVSATQCEPGSGGYLGSVMVKAPKNQKKFTIKGSGIEIKDDGKILMLRGHMHDGGIKMVFHHNGKEVCNSVASYNAQPVAGKAGGGHSHSGGSMGGDAAGAMGGEMGGGMGGMLSDMTGCLKTFEVKKGDKLAIEAYYDMEKHPAREHPNGGMAELMALGVVVFGRELK